MRLSKPFFQMKANSAGLWLESNLGQNESMPGNEMAAALNIGGGHRPLVASEEAALVAAANFSAGSSVLGRNNVGEERNSSAARSHGSHCPSGMQYHLSTGACRGFIFYLGR